MAITHTGNIQPQIDYEEHQGDIDAKRVVLVDKDTGEAYDSPGTGCVSLASGSAVKVTQNTAWSDPKTYIGLASVNIGALATGANYIGLASVNISPIPAGSSWVGLASISGDVGLNTGANYVGLASVNISPIPTGSAWIGLASVMGSIKLAGTTKTFVNVPIALNAAGSATLCVPTGKFHVTHLLLSSNATVTVNIKSGPTYLAGNATIGISLVPGGGWIENGTTDAPTYEGLVAAAGLVIDTDSTAEVGGKVLYFDE